MGIEDQLTANRARRAAAHTETLDAATEMETLVRAAFDAGLTGPQIAGLTGVSKRRTYQIRDGVR